jgi:hypothetical protein
LVLGLVLAIGLFFAPGILNGFRMARESSCTSNLLDVSRASLLYVDDFDRYLPPIYTYDPTTGGDESLLDALQGYLGGESKRCPSDSYEFRKYYSREVEGTGVLGYAHDVSLASHYDRKNPRLKLINLDRVGNLAEAVFFRDPIREITTHNSVPHLHSPHGDRFMSTNLEGSIRKLTFYGSNFQTIPALTGGSFN